MIYPTEDLIVEHSHQPDFWLKLKYPEEGGNLWVCNGFLMTDLSGKYLGEFRLTTRELESLYKVALESNIYNLNEEAA